jgi:hypothetical protein
MNKRNAVIVDVDGTLVDVSSVRHHVEGAKRDFDAFHRASLDCPPFTEVIERIQELHAEGIEVIVVSGREDRFRRLTDFWLAMWHVPCDQLVMRSSGDRRADRAVKAEMFQQISQTSQVIEAIDDRKELLDMWRELGVPSVVDVQNLVMSKRTDEHA